MSKGLKKGLLVSGIVILVIILILIAIPFLFKDKIKDAVLDTANKQLNAKVYIDDYGLSLFSNFPDATLSLDNLVIVGTDQFSSDTLLQSKQANATIDLFSLFGSNYDILKIELEQAKVHAKVLADGRANWNIVKEDSTQVSGDSKTETPFKMNLQKINVISSSVIYDEQEGNMKLILNGWNGSISGDFSASETTLRTESSIDEVTFMMGGVPYINKVKGTAHAEMNANFDSMKFTFVDSDLKLNDLAAKIDGSIAMVGEDGMDFDLKLVAPNTQFKDILSVVPAMYTNDFKDVKTSGSASLDAYMKGIMQGEEYPAFDVKIDVKDATFQYPSLPKSVDNINLNIAVNNKGGALDNTIIDINKFTFTLGGNPFRASLNVTTPMSDPNLKLQVNGIVDLGMIKEVYPLEKETELNGKITADLNLIARMSAIEKEQYDKISASGHLKVNNMVYKATDMPEVLVNNAGLEFTPRYVSLTSLDVKIGKNDLAATGRLDNLIGYMLKNQTLKGQLSVQSNYLNANDFISKETMTGADSTSSSSSEDIIIPKNIDFTLTTSMKHIVYDKLNITNLNGGMSVKDGILHLNNVNANALGGSCKINGVYDTSDPQKPKVNFDLSLTQVSFAETFKSIESIQKFAPIFENLQGTYSMNLNFNTSLGKTILETLAQLTGKGGLQTSSVKIDNNSALSAISSVLNANELKSFSAKDLNIPFTVEDGHITTKPFTVNIGDGGAMKLEGKTGLDQTIDYKGTVTLPAKLANNYIKNVGITIGGTFTSPKIGVDTKALAGSALDALSKEYLGGSVDEKKAELDTKTKEERAKQAKNLRDEAKQASDKLVQTAEEQSLKLQNASENPLAKVAAKKAGEKIVNEAKKQGQRLIDEAEIRAKQLEGETEQTATPTE